MFKSKVTDVFFDLDHTLWDFEKNSALTFEKIFQSHNVDVNLKEFLRVYVPKNLELWKLYGSNEITKEELRYLRLRVVFDQISYAISDENIKLLSEEYIKHLSSFNHLFSGAIEVLKYLKPKYNLHIITNGFKEVQIKKLKNSGIEGFFIEIIDSETAGVKKPNPIIFSAALEKAKVTAEESVMIGDNLEADILGAQALGIQAIHFNSHKNPEHNFCPIINHLGEIKTFL